MKGTFSQTIPIINPSKFQSTSHSVKLLRKKGRLRKALHSFEVQLYLISFYIYCFWQIYRSTYHLWSEVYLSICIRIALPKSMLFIKIQETIFYWIFVFTSCVIKCQLIHVVWRMYLFKVDLLLKESCHKFCVAWELWNLLVWTS